MSGHGETVAIHLLPAPRDAVCEECGEVAARLVVGQGEGAPPPIALCAACLEAFKELMADSAAGFVELEAGEEP